MNIKQKQDNINEETFNEFFKFDGGKKYKESKAVCKANKQKAIYRRSRWQYDEDFRLNARYRTTLNKSINNNKNYGNIEEELGCTIQELKKYIEIQFKDGMNWNNRSVNSSGWSIDHIEPLSQYDFRNEEDRLKACRFSNLRPVWARDNKLKGNKIIK